MKSRLQIFLVCLISFNLSAQTFDLLGIIDDQLVKINSNALEVEVVGKINPSPPELVRFLTYVEEECLFYGIMNSSLVPTLISIDLDLNFVEIGILSIPGGTIYFSEGLSFNSFDNKLYASGSINGSTSNGDYYSESLIEVDRSNASCIFITEIVGNVARPDIDRMTFFDNTLYFQDAQPSIWSKFFELEFLNLNVTSQAEQKKSIGYTPLKDLEYNNGNIYYSVGRDLSYYDINSYNYTDLGTLFFPADYDGEEITGLSINPFPDHLSLADEVYICGDEYLLELEYPYGSVSWNNGETGSSILVTESGMYWADILYNGCVHRTDTIEITLILPLDFSLGADTVLCNDESLYISFSEPNVSVQWSDGSTGEDIIISETGIYWAEYIKDGCTFYTDTIIVEVLFEEFELGLDATLCNGEILTLFLDGADQNVIWNNGETGNPIEISLPGTYWADVFYNDCAFRSDTIEVSFIQPINFSIGADTVICNGTTISYLINEPNITVMWSDGSIGNEISINESGTYWAEYINEGCTFFTDTITVIVVENEYTIGPDLTLCEGENYTLSLEGAGQNISWNTGYTGNQLVITEPGSYWAEILIDDCEFRTDTIDVFYIESIDFSLVQDTLICKGETILFSINEPNTTVFWSDGTVGSEILISETGSYFGQYNKDGCQFYTDSIFVEVVDNEYTIPSELTLCEGEIYSLSLEGVGQNVNWNNGYSGNPIEISESGVYWAEVAYQGCEIMTNSIIVEVIQSQPITLGSDTIMCGGNELMLEVENPTLDYLWSTGEIGESIIVSENGTYWVTSFNNECETKSDSVQISFIEDPKITFNLDTILCFDEELVLTNAFYDIEWRNEELENLTSIEESGNFLGEYYVENCYFQTDTIFVEFADCTPCEYFIPNILSPNFDGINDGFMVVFSKFCNIIDFEISIFDRWGNLVHNSKDNYWNGMINSKSAADGVYGYAIKLNSVTYNGDVQESVFFGDVTIIK